MGKPTRERKSLRAIGVADVNGQFVFLGLDGSWRQRGHLEAIPIEPHLGAGNVVVTSRKLPPTTGKGTALAGRLGRLCQEFGGTVLGRFEPFDARDAVRRAYQPPA
jgi:hypothetical protein